MNRTQLAQYIDHTLLRPDATSTEIQELVRQALKWKTYAVCVNSGYVRDAAAIRGANTSLHIAATIGFPLGQANTASKVAEAQSAITDGADELDLVWNLGRFLSGDRSTVTSDIAAVVRAAGRVPVKVILETARLTPEQIRQGAALAVEAGATTVKTSTGFGFSGATRESVEILRDAVGPGVGVKAAGGIRRYADALDLIEAGATRLGLSQTQAVLNETPR